MTNEGVRKQFEEGEKAPAGGPPVRVRVEALVRASPDAVWSAWTTPEDIVGWNAASDDWHTTRAHVDLRVGGVYGSRMEAKDGSAGFDFEATITSVMPPTYLAYTLGEDRPVEVSFEATADGVWVRETFVAETTFPLELQRAGWQSILDRFAAWVEGKG